MRRATAMRTVVLSEAERNRKLAELTDFVRPLVAAHHTTGRRASSSTSTGSGTSRAGRPRRAGACSTSCTAR